MNDDLAIRKGSLGEHSVINFRLIPNLDRSILIFYHPLKDCSGFSIGIADGRMNGTAKTMVEIIVSFSIIYD